MRPKDAEGIANSVDPDQTALIWVCTVCPGLCVRKLRIITVMTGRPGAQICPGWPGKITSSPNTRNYFNSSDFSKMIRHIFSISRVFSTIFRDICWKRMPLLVKSWLL